MATAIYEFSVKLHGISAMHLRCALGLSYKAKLNRAVKGTFSKMSPKHTQRYLDEFAGRLNTRDLDKLDHLAGSPRGWSASHCHTPF